MFQQKQDIKIKLSATCYRKRKNYKRQAIPNEILYEIITIHEKLVAKKNKSKKMFFQR